ncbi:unnamed protein product [Nesidiocoris tenuis]|uniref:Uncharacterized protein n=1 Tax=Nesidiocoris tenuis TaxID=355587 RepID=A0A6H5HTS2_9HEMI|nr:unnamed protein product [Nesidiocoris tenuis]
MYPANIGAHTDPKFGSVLPSPCVMLQKFGDKSKWLVKYPIRAAECKVQETPSATIAPMRSRSNRARTNSKVNSVKNSVPNGNVTYREIRISRWICHCDDSYRQIYSLHVAEEKSAKHEKHLQMSCPCNFSITMIHCDFDFEFLFHSEFDFKFDYEFEFLLHSICYIWSQTEGASNLLHFILDRRKAVDTIHRGKWPVHPEEHRSLNREI